MKINFKNTWRPLPSCVTIKTSGIEGLGLYAIEDIPKGTDLGLTRIMYHGEFIRTALGSYLNHVDNNPNCINVPNENIHGDICCYLITKDDIKSGDEMTLTYQMAEYPQIS